MLIIINKNIKKKVIKIQNLYQPINFYIEFSKPILII